MSDKPDWTRLLEQIGALTVMLDADDLGPVERVELVKARLALLARARTILAVKRAAGEIARAA